MDHIGKENTMISLMESKIIVLIKEALNSKSDLKFNNLHFTHQI